MDVQKISPTSTAYCYDNISDYLTYVYLIEKKNRFYLIDTFCGPESMIPIIQTIHHSPSKDLVVINTHFHWDHVWGNGCFPNHPIVSHILCREFLDKFWEDQVAKNKRHFSGNVIKVLPNTTFDSKIIFHDDNIEVFSSPGHTKDCISILDHEEKILYAGDNLEKPIVYVENKDIATYIETLKKYLIADPQQIVAGHTLNVTKADIAKTIEYLTGLADATDQFFETEYEKTIHCQNLQTVHGR